MFPLQVLQLLFQASAVFGDLPDYMAVIFFQEIERGQSDPARESISGESRSVFEGKIIGVNILPTKAGADWHQPAAERFGDSNNIRGNALSFARKHHPGAAQTCLDFIDD